MYHHVAQFVERTSTFLSNCPLKDRLRDLIKNASKIFRFFGYSSALVLSSQIDDQEGCNYLFGSSSSTHLRATYLIDSPIWFSPHEQLITFVKNAVVCLILFEIWKSDVFVVFQTLLNLYLYQVKKTIHYALSATICKKKKKKRFRLE